MSGYHILRHSIQRSFIPWLEFLKWPSIRSLYVLSYHHMIYQKYVHNCDPPSLSWLSPKQPTASRGCAELRHWMSFSLRPIRMRTALPGCPARCRTWETQSVICPTPAAVPTCLLANAPVSAATATTLRVTSTRATKRTYPVTVQLSSAQR